jgi:hypothetical protein
VIGRRTGFSYYAQSPGRRILVRISAKNAEQNNYFDGPGDQVPFWLSIRDLLHQAYPATIQGQGIDEHGVYLGTKQWTRIAISPYAVTDDISNVEGQIERCSPFSNEGEFASCITKEWWNTSTWMEGVKSRLLAEGKSGEPFLSTKLAQIRKLELVVSSALESRVTLNTGERINSGRKHL